MNRWIAALALVLLGASACKGCGAETVATTAWTPPASECKGYHFKAQQSGETVLLTVTREQEGNASVVTTLTFKSPTLDGKAFSFAKSEPPVVTAPGGSATVDAQQLCMSFGANDGASDVCLTKFVEAGHAGPTCVAVTRIQ